MANTNKLRTIVEPELIEKFCEKFRCRKLAISQKDFRDIFFGIQPDFIAYDEKMKILYIGEITVSGFLGRKGKDFHIGGTRKLAEVFSKFYLFNLEKNRFRICQAIGKLSHINIRNISCHLVVPQDTRFINALGYRTKLFETGIMKLEKLPLSDRCQRIVVEILQSAKEERN